MEPRDLARRERVDVPPDGIESLRDLESAPRRRPFEQEVLEEVRRTADLCLLIARPDTDPCADRNRPLAGHLFGDDANPRWENGALEPHSRSCDSAAFAT